jgi:hypothetical protein
MSVNIKDLFNSASQRVSVSSAKDYLSKNARRVSTKVATAAKPYTDMAEQNVKSAKTFVHTKVDEVRKADSLGAAVDILVGIAISVMQIIMSILSAVRSLIMTRTNPRVVKAYSAMESYAKSICNKFVGFPNLPVVKKVEGVSKKVLGDSRHDQALDFIKTNVIDKVYEKFAAPNSAAQKSPSGSSTADLTTEGGSVTGSSPRDSSNRRPKTHQRRK